MYLTLQSLCDSKLEVVDSVGVSLALSTAMNAPKYC